MSHKLSSQWYGWPGTDISEGEKKDVKEKLWRDHHAVPVRLPENSADSYYNGFSSERLSVSYCRACWQMEADKLQTQCYGHFFTNVNYDISQNLPFSRRVDPFWPSGKFATTGVNHGSAGHPTKFSYA